MQRISVVLAASVFALLLASCSHKPPANVAAQVNGHAIPPETYRESGSFVYARDIPAGWLTPGRNRVEFMLDKALHVDDRELGLVVVSAALD